MATTRNGFEWQRFVPVLFFTCAVLAYRNIDTQGYSRQFISKVNHDCRDFKVVRNKCQVWKDLGFCFKYRREMQHVCNKTCQYCVPGQKQWQVVDRVWGQVRKPAGQPQRAHALASAMQHKGPAVQILGKERAPQIDDAANAIATQLEAGIDRGISASPDVEGLLTKSQSGFKTPFDFAVSVAGAKNRETEGKLSKSQPVSPTQLDNQREQQTNTSTIGGKTQKEPLIQKPAMLLDSRGGNVTVTINERPGIGETVFRMQTSPKDNGVSYKAEENRGGLSPPYYSSSTEDGEDKATSDEEEEANIREATQAIENVLNLFHNGNTARHTRGRLVTKTAHDSPADSKSMEVDHETAKIQNEIDAQVKSQDRAAAKAQALSQHIGQELSPNKKGAVVSKTPNYEVISTSESGDWKNLARALATQLKRVLNHMEDREKENQYEREKIQEEMMMMEQQQMMARDGDEGSDDEYEDEGDGEMMDGKKRRHSVQTPSNNTGNATKNVNVKDQQSKRSQTSKKTDEEKLLHRTVQTLYRLQIMHKSQSQKHFISSSKNQDIAVRTKLKY